MLVTEVNEALPGGSSLLRNEPVQARSSARLTGLLDAAAAIIDEIGFERLTTAMVAERAGASIGTVYRYFPDRIAVVEALAARSIQRLFERVGLAVDAGDVSDWREVADLAIDAEVDMYRNEPGFRSVRFGDATASDTASAAALDATVDAAHLSLGSQFTTFLVGRFDLERTSALEFAVEVSAQMGSALVARAFATDSAGDERFIAECRTIVSTYLAGVAL